MHYYKFNIADWALHTAHLSLEEEAIYFRLINFYYDTEQPIPLETQPVIRRLRLGNDSDLVDVILSEYFVKTEKGFIHNRCEALLKEYRKTAKKNKANGAKGGRPRKDVASSESQNKPSGLNVGCQVEPKHNPNQELLTINQEPLNNNTSFSGLSPDLLNSISDHWNEIMTTQPKVKLTDKTQINKKRWAKIKKITKDHPNYLDHEYWEGYIHGLASHPDLQWQRENRQLTFDQAVQLDKFERNRDYMLMGAE